MTSIEANAKINLTLDIVGLRPDGYHELRTVMHEIPLADTITLSFEGEGVRCITNLPYIKSGTNLALRAANAFYERTGISEGLSIRIKKRIPVGAGLGGGSADAAAVLRFLNGRHGSPLGTDELMRLGAELGADVPFCISGGCALCEGIGERITPLKRLPHCSAVVAKPQTSLSTREMFRRIDRWPRRRERPDTRGFLAALEAGDLDGLAKRMYNSMEPAAASLAGEITEIKTSLLRLGALGACMSGSGSSVAALFDTHAAAQSAAEALCGRDREIFVLDL